ncbi:hypothetical protein [Allofranklinella schreckenbergeri]|uniref:hypothetical protein n=1 Tax=Allofranklinella schreckenbergeri TaxID=1076744 RepID=UPI0011C41B5A|nr:hypothetical protein [Allofranklinella schreckenbergeri]
MTEFFQKKMDTTNHFPYEMVELDFQKTHKWALDKLINGPSLGVSRKLSRKLTKNNFSFITFLPNKTPILSIYSFKHSFGDFSYESEWRMINFLKSKGKSKNILLCEDWTMQRSALNFQNGVWHDHNFKEKILLQDEDFYCYATIDEFLAWKVPSKLNGSACYTFQGFLLNKEIIIKNQEVANDFISHLIENIEAILFFGVYDGEGCIAAINHNKINGDNRENQTRPRINADTGK